MDATLVCWSCKAEKQIEVAAPPMFAFEGAGWAQDVGWIRERGPLGSWRTYYGEAARVMALVLRYSR